MRICLSALSSPISFPEHEFTSLTSTLRHELRLSDLVEVVHGALDCKGNDHSYCLVSYYLSVMDNRTKAQSFT